MSAKVANYLIVNGLTQISHLIRSDFLVAVFEVDGHAILGEDHVPRVDPRLDRQLTVADVVVRPDRDAVLSCLLPLFWVARVSIPSCLKISGEKACLAFV